MFDDVKNPFGIRDGHLITVNDLREDEKGLACNCVCPLCHAPFEAKLGEVRIHHFAHSGKGCNQTSAYLMGLYGIFREFILSHSCTIPRVIVFYNVKYPYPPQFTSDNVFNRISFYPYDNCCSELYKETSLTFDSAEIKKGDYERPEALIAQKKDKQIAFVISPPESCIKSFIPKRYKEYATIEINLSKMSRQISHATKEEMYGIFSDVKNYTWLFTPIVSSMSNIKKLNVDLEKRISLLKKEYYENKEKEKQMRHEEKRIREQREQEYRKRIENIRKASFQEMSEARRNESQQLPIIPRTETRMVTCSICGKTAPLSDFWTYEGSTGKCYDCYKKGKY